MKQVGTAPGGPGQGTPAASVLFRLNLTSHSTKMLTPSLLHSMAGKTVVCALFFAPCNELFIYSCPCDAFVHNMQV